MEAPQATPHLPPNRSRALTIAQSFASRANSVLLGAVKLATTGATLSIPAFFVFNPEVKNLLSTDTFITITGLFSGTLSFGVGTILAKRQIQDFDQALADLYGHEPIFVRLNRYRYRNDIDRLKENGDYPVASIDIDMGSYKEFLPEGFRWYYSGHVIPQDINSLIYKVTENLGFYPKELLESHIQSILIHDNNSDRTGDEDEKIESEIAKLPDSIREKLLVGLQRRRENHTKSFVGGRANRSDKNITIAQTPPRGNLDAIVHHEMSHMALLHIIIRYFEQPWEEEFGTMQEDQTEYSDYPLFETDISYGVMYSYEDMATIAQMMFSKDGWDSLLNRAQQNKTNGVRPGIFMRKIIRMKEFFYKQSGGLIDETYFNHIQQGTISSWEQAQEYFKMKRSISKK